MQMVGNSSTMRFPKGSATSWLRSRPQTPLPADERSPRRRNPIRASWRPGRGPGFEGAAHVLAVLPGSARRRGVGAG
jgi:hypothetical protein